METVLVSDRVRCMAFFTKYEFGGYSRKKLAILDTSVRKFIQIEKQTASITILFHSRRLMREIVSIQRFSKLDGSAGIMLSFPALLSSLPAVLS